MRVGECKWLSLYDEKIVVERAIEDEYDIIYYGTNYNNRMVQLHMITAPGDNLEVMFMEMMWLHCGVQLGYHQVVNLFES